MSFITSLSYAQEINLKQAIYFAIENNVQLKSALLDKTVHLHELKITKQKFSPQLSLNVALSAQNEDYFNEDFDEKKIHSYPSLKWLTPIGTQVEVFSEQNLGYERGQRKTGNALRIVVEQPLLKGRKKIVNTWSIENTQILREIEDLVLKQTLEQIIYNVIVYFHSLQLAAESVKLHERWVLSAQRFHESLQERVASGRAPRSDLSSSSLQVNQAKSDLAQSHFEYRQAMRKFQELIGIQGDLNIIPDYSQGSNLPFQDKNHFHQVVLENDIETKIVNLNKARMQKQLLVAKDQQLLDVRLRGDWTFGRYHIYGISSDNLNWNDSTNFNYPFIHQSGNYSAHLLFNIPITGKDARHHQTLAAKIELEKIELEARFHQQQLENYTNGLLEQFSLKEEQIKLSIESIKLAQQNYDNAMLKLDAGRATMFEVISTQEKLHDAQLNLNAAKIAYLDILTHLEMSAGMLEKKWLA